MLESLKMKVNGEWYVSKSCVGENPCETCDLRRRCVDDDENDISTVCGRIGKWKNFRKEEKDAEKA